MPHARPRPAVGSSTLDPSAVTAAHAPGTNLAELLQLRALYDAVHEHMPVAFLVAEAPTGRLLYWNVECERLLGHPMHATAEGAGHARYGAEHPDGTPYGPHEYATMRALAGEVVDQAATRYRRGDGTLVWLSVSTSPVRDADGRITHAVVTFVDATARHRAEEALREGRERLGAALEASGTGTFRWDIRTNALEWDESLDRLFGLAPGVTARSLEHFVRTVHESDRARVIAACARCAADGAHFDEEFRVVWPDGAVRWLHDKGRTFLGDDGRPAYMTGACVDVTERRDQAEQVRLLAETMPQIVWTTRPDGFHDYFNGRWYEYTGMRRPAAGEAPLGWSWSDYLHPDDAERIADCWRESLETGTPYDVEYRFREAATGAYRWFLGRAMPMRDAAGHVMRWFGTCTDIDAQVRETERAQRLERLGRALAAAVTPQSVSAAVVAEGIEALGAFGGSIALLDGPDTLALAGVAGGTPDGVVARWSRFPRSAPVPMAIATREGRAFWLASREELAAVSAVAVALWEESGLHAAAVVPIRLGERVLGSLNFGFDAPRVLRDDERRFIELLAQQCAGALERARLYEVAERARAEAERANRVKSDFLAAMSHELRTPLNAIDGHSALVEEGIHGPVTEAQRGALARVRRSARLLLALINDLLSYARVEAGKVEYRLAPVPVDEVLRAVADMVRPQMESRRLAFACEPFDPDARVLADADRLQQIVINLVTNAMKFTPEGGRVVLRARRPADAGAVLVEVQDTGIGIAPDAIERVFAPFVQVASSRASQQQGVGLGLAISRDLARGMGGDLTAESAPGLGSTFSLRLPEA